MISTLRSQLENRIMRTSAPPDDEQLLIREAVWCVQAAEQNDAFAELYRRYVDRVYRYVVIRVGNTQDAQDVTSQTFLAALESIASYRSRSSFPGWLLAIARHKAADYFRHHRPTVSLESALHVAQSDYGPDELIGGQLNVERIAAALRILSPDRAEALALHIFGGLDPKEVAQAMGKSDAAAKMLVHRGLRDLRQQLAHLDEEK